MLVCFRGYVGFALVIVCLFGVYVGFVLGGWSLFSFMLGLCWFMLGFYYNCPVYCFYFYICFHRYHLYSVCLFCCLSVSVFCCQQSTKGEHV